MSIPFGNMIISLGQHLGLAPLPTQTQPQQPNPSLESPSCPTLPHATDTTLQAEHVAHIFHDIPEAHSLPKAKSGIKDFLSPGMLSAISIPLTLGGGEVLADMAVDHLEISAALLTSAHYPSLQNLLLLSLATSFMEYGLVDGFLPKRLKDRLLTSTNSTASWIGSKLNWFEKKYALIAGGLAAWTQRNRNSESAGTPIPYLATLKNKLSQSSSHLVSGISAVVPGTVSDAKNLFLYAGITTAWYGLFTYYCEPPEAFKDSLAYLIPTTTMIYSLTFNQLSNNMQRAFTWTLAAITIGLCTGMLSSDTMPESLKLTCDVSTRLAVIAVLATTLAKITKNSAEVH